MKKTAFAKSFIFSCLIALFLSSCSDLSESFNAPLPKFFSENTDSSEIARFDFVTEGAIKADDGYWNFPSESDFTIRFYLKNPQGYSFILGKNMTVEPESSEIYQDSSKNYFVFTYKKEFLAENEGGNDISPTIRLFHPVSNASFEPYSALKIRSNTEPPKPKGLSVYHDRKKYILAFNMPSRELMSGIHSDISRIEIKIFDSENNLLKEEKADVVVKEDGTFSISGNNSSSFVLSDETSRYINAANPFTSLGQPVMYFSDVEVKESETRYEVLIKDRSGLKATEKIDCPPIEKNVINSVFVSDSGDDLNEGSAESPLRTIKSAINALSDIESARNTITLLSDITENVNVTEQNLVLTVKGGGNSISGDLSLSVKSIAFENISISGGMTFSGNVLYVSNSTLGNVELKKQDAKLSLNGATEIESISLFAQGQKIVVDDVANSNIIKINVDSSAISHYGLGTEILTAPSGVTLTESDIEKFSLESEKYTIRLDSSKNAGVVSDIKATDDDDVGGGIQIEIVGGDYSFEVSTLTPKFGDSITLTVKKGSENITPESYEMQLVLDGDFEHPVMISESNSIMVPSYLATSVEKRCQLYMRVKLFDGTVIDKTVAIMVSQ